MTLAPDAIVIELDGAVLSLRPTLKAALRLDRREGGFPALVEEIVDGNMGAMADVIHEAADRPTAIVDLLRDTAIHGAERLIELREPLLQYLGQLVAHEAQAGEEGKPEKSADQNAPTISRAEYLDRLFRIGTGYIGWTPAETLAASPAELQAAYEGRLDLLKAIFGTGDEEKREARKQIPLSQRVSATMSALGAKVVKRPRRDG